MIHCAFSVVVNVAAAHTEMMTQLQEELGLRLDSQRGPGDVLVIDGAERPAPD